MNISHDAFIFLGFFLAGLAVNLTPCVYPMLTVTVSLFKPRAHANETLRHSFARALAYFLGIVVMYSVLGYSAAFTGKLFGSILQNRWVLLGIAGMMFVLALSMFGFYQLRPPVELLNRLAGLRKVNYAGLFMSGMFVGVFAAPCIGPPVLALLAAVANNGSPAFGLSAFFTFSMGMGLPYLVLGTCSGFMTQLPKAGKWLVWVERFFGVGLLSFGIFYLLLALHINLPSGNGGMVWTPYSAQAVQASIAHKKPVVVDFYADWCIGCHEMDHTVFSDPKTRARLAQFTALRVDATKINDAKIQALIHTYSIIGLPTVLFLDEKGQEIKDARVEGSASVKEFTGSLKLLAKATHMVLQE